MSVDASWNGLGGESVLHIHRPVLSLGAFRAAQEAVRGAVAGSAPFHPRPAKHAGVSLLEGATAKHAYQVSGRVRGMDPCLLSARLISNLPGSRYDTMRARVARVGKISNGVGTLAVFLDCPELEAERSLVVHHLEGIGRVKSGLHHNRNPVHISLGTFAAEVPDVAIAAAQASIPAELELAPVWPPVKHDAIRLAFDLINYAA